MEYKKLSYDALLERAGYLERLNKQLLKEKEQDVKLEYGWTGNLGHWYWDIKTNNVVFNPLKIKALGYTKDEIPKKVNYQFFTEKLHPDDYQKTMAAMNKHLNGNAAVYEVEYRIKTKNGQYKWYYDRGKITQYDDKGKPSFLAGIVFDITEQKEMQSELEYKNKILAVQSSTDGLTQISNHRVLIERLKSGLIEANRINKPLSIAIFDIDDFKKVNDNEGHIFGDKILVGIAAIIQKNIRNTDLAGRYGGEEFMVIFFNTDIGIAFNIAERIRKAVEDTTFINKIRVTISGGVKQHNGEEISDFIHSADLKLYEAKREGKNRIKY